MVAVEDVEIVVAHQARATLRVGDVYLKVDPEQDNIAAEVEAMALAPVPTPKVLWHQPPVLALSAVPGTALGRLGEPSPHPAAAWVATGAAIRRLHDAPLPPKVGPSLDLRAAKLAEECGWLIANEVLPADLVDHGYGPAEDLPEVAVLWSQG
jgi:aminoglycoside phosphotransferase